MMRKKVLIILFLITFVASILRLYKLGEVPSSPNWDEVSLGYNSYSILKTGKDEYGAFLPVILRSFDDYKPALYAYFLAPFIYVFGLETWVVRLPSAIFGIITVLITYFLVKELLLVNPKSEIRNVGKAQLLRSAKQIQNSNNRNLKHNIKDYASVIALITSGLLAISPWHIQFSRIAFESNVGMALNVIALFLFVKGLKNPIFLVVSFAVGALNIHMYQSEKVFTPLFLLALTIIFYKQILKTRYYFLTAIFVAFIITAPFLNYIFINPDALLRAKGVSIFSDQTEFLKRNVSKLYYDQESGNLIGLVFDNRRIEYAKAIASGYISHFDLNWLFINGDIARHHAPNMGLLYIFELPFLFIGIYKLIFGEFDKRIKLAVFSYFLLVPIPASITSGVPHAVRTLNFLPIFQIFVALGIIAIFKQILNIQISRASLFASQKVKYLILILCFLFFIFNFLYYLNQYFVQQNYFHAKEWLYGYRQAIDYIKPISRNYNKIVVSNEPPLDQSYMFFLYYLRFDPFMYQQLGGTQSGGFAKPHRGFGNFTFRPIIWEHEKKDSSYLYIGRPNDFPDTLVPLKIIYYPDKSPAIVIVKG